MQRDNYDDKSKKKKYVLKNSTQKSQEQVNKKKKYLPKQSNPPDQYVYRQQPPISSYYFQHPKPTTSQLQQSYHHQTIKKIPEKQTLQHNQKQKFNNKHQITQNNDNKHPNKDTQSKDFITKISSPILHRLYDTQIKRIKKLFLEVTPDAKDIVIKYSQTHPCIFIQYTQNQKKQTFLLSYLVKANKKLQKEKNILSTLYSSLYDSVDPKFYDLKQFALLQVSQKRIRMTPKSLQYDRSKENLMFYYRQHKRKVNFLLINSYLTQVSFSSAFVEKKAEERKREYVIFQKFMKSIEKEDPIKEEKKDIFGLEEVQSDKEQNITHEETPLQKQYNKLEELLEKDLSELQQKIQIKNDTFNNKRQQNGVSQQEIQRLGDQIEELQISLQNYNDARQKVKQTLSEVNKHSHNYKKMVSLCLKKMIMAQKQMESRLPILTKKNEIFQLLNKRNLIILEGQTGSGKSTQLPQLLCEYYKIFDDPYAKPVLVTQPRRLATRTLAERVAFQMEEKVRGFVDYAASADREINPRAKIIFKLDRLVLDELTIDQTLSKYSCMVIDEAHERTISIDVILGLVKKLLQLRKDFKIIVTSASMDTQLFKKYFRTDILKVSGRLYPVDIFYKDYRQDNTVRKVYKVITEQILNENMAMKENYKGHVLVFCSGVDQINELYQMFRKLLNPHIFKVYALHGKIAPQQQKQVFLNTKQYKIIFASRIAQTAITIDGVRVVIDPGQDRELVYDQKNKISSWKLQKISQSSAKQRAGRAGRTRAGFCFRLYSENSFKKDFRPNKVPQIENMALDTLVLRLKSLNIDNVVKFPYISPPNEQGLKISIQTMKMIGCLNQQQKITEIGKLLIKIPIQPFLSRAIAEAMMFEFIQNDQRFWKFSYNQNSLRVVPIVQSVIQILCMVIHSSNLFMVKAQQRQDCQRIKFEQFKNQDGDFFFFRNIYEKFINLYRSKNKAQLHHWSRDKYLSLKTLHTVRQLESQISSIIRKFSPQYDNMQSQIDIVKAKIKYCKREQDMILASLITSFCTNLCIFSGNPQLGYTLFSQKRPIQIYGTSNLSLQGINPKWIVCFDLITNDKGRYYCKVAHTVDFNLLQSCVDQYVYNKFRLQEAKLINPFYEQLKYSNMATIILKDIQSDYRKKQYQNRYQFLKEVNLFANQDLNKLQIYYLKDSKVKSKSITNQNSQENLDIIIKKYIQNKQQQFNRPYRHIFIASTVVVFKKGCEIQYVQLINTQSEYTLIVNDYQSMIIQQNSSKLGRIQRFQQKNGNIKLKILIDDQENAKTFQELIKVLKTYYQMENLFCKKQLVDKRKKTPTAKIFIYFFAGKVDNRNIFVSYQQQNGKNPAQQMLPILKKLNLRNYSLYLSKNKNGINFKPILQNPFMLQNRHPLMNQGQLMDEFELRQKIFKFKQDPQRSGYNFVLPKSYRMFRDPQTPQCTRSNQQWTQQILALMKKAGIQDNSNTTIKVWGYYSPSRADGKKITVYEKTFRVDMYAEIKTLNLSHLQKLKKQYDNKSGILGCQKVHMKFQFQQTIAIISQRVYNSLIDEYNYRKTLFKIRYPHISFDQFSINRKKQNMMCIRVRSQHREDILEPSRVISKVFSPKFIQLNDFQFKFIDKIDIGQEILDNLEFQYHYRIYFTVQRFKSRVKLYCDDSFEKQIQQALLQRINQYKYFIDRVSYRGKDLNKVKQILDKQANQIQLQKTKNPQKPIIFQYQILFQSRQVQITSDYETQEQIKNKINKLLKCQKPECSICCSIIQKPYKLLNCKDKFCWLCLSNHISSFKSSIKKQLILCPEEDCKQSINIYDIKTILTQQDFQKICDMKTKHYVESNKMFHVCLSPNCQQVFQVKQSKENKSFECDLCGKWYCYQCKLSHQHYTCQQWKKNSRLQQQDLKKLGIKKCPYCNQGIQKNNGCQHMTCLKCQTHICWQCMKTFKTGRQCYDHLAKQCGGIFRPNAI